MEENASYPYCTGGIFNAPEKYIAISLCFKKYHILKNALQTIFHIDHNVTEYFGFLCKGTMNARHFIFNIKHSIVNLNNINQFHDNPSVFTVVRAQSVDHTADRHTEVIKLQLRYNLMVESVNKKYTKLETQCIKPGVQCSTMY